MRRALCLVLILVAGCGDDEEAATTGATTTQPAPAASPHVVRVGKPTGTEREYVHTVGEWLLAEIGVGGDCRASLDEYAGKPPTERMAQLAEAAADACAGRVDSDVVVTRIAGYELHWGGAQALPVRGGRTRVSRVEPKFTDAAKELTGGDTEVRCWSPADWRAVASAGSPYDEDDEGAIELAGFVADDLKIHLAPDICDGLVQLAYGKVDGGDADVAFAVAALAHEARHTMGEQREDRTECWAVQNAERMARLLGADEKTAAELAEVYWKEVYPLGEPPYFSEACRNNGPLDLHPESDDWP